MKRGGGPAQHKAREAMIKIMAVVVPIILVMALIGDRYIFGGSKFGTAKSLKYGLMLLAVVAAIVGGYFLLKKPEGKKVRSNCYQWAESIDGQGNNCTVTYAQATGKLQYIQCDHKGE